jgi:YD repeat-containing protein
MGPDFRGTVVYGTLFLALVSAPVQAQTADYHLHKEASSSVGMFQLKTGAPDAASLAIQTADLKNQATGEYVLKQFDTQAGDPNVSGAIPSGSTLSFTLWMKKTASFATLFPRARVKVNNASGVLLCEATGTSAVTTTLASYALSCTTGSSVTLGGSDRLYLWVGVNVTSTAGNHSVAGELDVEGSLNGNYDSRLTVPLPAAGFSITSLNPTSGAVGQPVTIAGTNFGPTQGTSTVTFNGVPATITSWSDTSIGTTAPPGATTGPVLVRLNGQASNGVTFTVLQPPTISSLNPTNAVTGQAVTIGGTIFGATQGTSTVTFNGVPASATSWNDTSIQTTVPIGADTGPVVVTVSGRVSNGVTFTVNPPPPPPGPSTTYHLHKEASATSGFFQLKTTGPDGTSLAVQTVDLKNQSFGGDYIIAEFDTQVGVPNVVGMIPSGAALSFTVWMKKTATYGTLLPRVRAKLNNASGALLCEATGGSALATTLTAYTLSCATTTDVAFTNSDRIYLWVGVNVTGLPGNHTVKGELDIEGALNGNYDSRFTVPGLVPPPILAGLNPSTGLVGQAVTITGSNFGVAQWLNTVTFNGTAASVTTWSDTSIAATVPLGATTGPVVVTVLQGSNAMTFTVFGTMSGTVTQAGSGVPIVGATIQALQAGQVRASATSTPSGSYVMTNAPSGIYDLTVALTGYGAQSRSGVTVPSGGGVSVDFALATGGAVTYTYDGLNRLTGVTDPTGASARYVYDAVGNPLSIERQGSGAVSVLSFYPASGAAGATVTIAGAGFGTQPGQNTVLFNGTTATVMASAATDLTVIVPAGATTGPIAVTSPSGTASSSIAFTVTTVGVGPPTITGFTPIFAPPGTTVTITGTNLEPSPANNVIRLNTPRVPVMSATATTLTATIPQFSGSGHFSLATPGGSTLSAADFFVWPDGYTFSGQQLGFGGRTTIGQSTVVTLDPATHGMLLFDGVAAQRISVKATNVTGPFTCNGVPVTPVYLFGTDGRTTGAPDQCNFIGPYVLPVTGTYELVLKDTASATIAINEVIDITGTMAINEPSRTITIATPGQVARFTFNGVAGEPITLSATTTWPHCGTFDFMIRGPNDVFVTNTWPCYASTLNMTLPVTGTYTLQVNSYLGDIGITTARITSP